MAHDGRVPPNLGQLTYHVSSQVVADLTTVVAASRRRAVGASVDRLADNPFPSKKDVVDQLNNGVSLWRTYSGEYRIVQQIHYSTQK